MKATKLNLFHLSYCIVLVILFFNTNRVDAQIVNGGFEQWTTSGPADWMTDDYPGQGMIPVTKSTDAYSGTYALMGQALKINDTLAMGIPPMIAAGTKGYGFPCSQRIKAVSLYLKYAPVGSDEILILAGLYSGDTASAQGIGLGVYKTVTAASSYQKITIPINYKDNTSVPDHLIFEVLLLGTAWNFPLPINFTLPGNLSSMLPSNIKFYAPHAGSTFLIDDVSTDTTSSGGGGGGGGTGNAQGGVLLLKYPQSGAIISGEQNTLGWSTEDTSIHSYNLWYTLNGGPAHYLVKNYNDTLFNWDVPDTMLCRYAQFWVDDAEDTAVYDVENYYIKPYQLTRVDNSGNFVLFDPKRDGWNFYNDVQQAWPKERWQGIDYKNGIDPIMHMHYALLPFHSAKSNFFPTWTTFVQVFGIRQCYLTDIFGNQHFNPVASTVWFGIAHHKWEGSCYGFSVSSLLYFYYKDDLLNKFSGLGNYPYLNKVSTSAYVQEMLAYYWTYQEGNPFATDEYNKQKKTDAKQVLAQLKVMLSANNADAEVLNIFNKSGSSGHTVTPYRLEKINSSGKYRLRLYNCNVPNSDNSVIIIDSLHDTWTDSTKGFDDKHGNPIHWGTQTKHIYLSLRSHDYLKPPEFTANPIVLSVPSHLSLQQPSPVTIFNTGTANIKVENSAGYKVGYAGDTVFNNLNGAVPMIQITSRESPPIGYWLPEGNYSVTMNNFSDTTAYAFFMTDTLIYNYIRSDADSNQEDILNFKNGLNIKNPDASVKNINIESIVNMGSAVKTFRITNFKDFPGDSNHVQILDLKNLFLQNFGKNKSYDLRVSSVLANSVVNFVHKGVQLPANSTQLIEPMWNDTSDSQIKILIDNGNNGTYNDTMYVSNEVTEVKGIYSSTVPKDFKLYQNYPNPFNPTTTIRYQVPRNSFVTLKVYNSLGQLVKTLVNGRRPAGSYSVHFDGSGLSSGVYFYVLHAGRFRGVKKFVLLK